MSGSVKLDGDVETAILGRDEADARVDGDVAQLHLLAARHRGQRALEAGGVAHGEQLLGVGAVLVVLGGGTELDVEVAVTGDAMPVRAASGDWASAV